MATFSVNSAKSATLVADTVDEVTVGAAAFFRNNGQQLWISNRHATGVLTATIDGTTPTELGDDMIYVGPGEHFSVPRPSRGDVVVKLISSDPVPYWVRLV